MFLDFTKYYVRIYIKTGESECWQTLGPYGKSFATQLMYNYLKKGICCWIEGVKIDK